LKGNALLAYRDLVNKLVAKALKETGLPRSEIVVRPMRPDDLGRTNPEWYFDTEPASAAAWNTLISQYTIADNRWIGIYGVYNNEGASECEELKITREGKVVRYWPIAQIKYFENKTGFADDPITVDQNTKITVELRLRSTSTLTDFSLLGVVVEKKGLLIYP